IYGFSEKNPPLFFVEVNLCCLTTSGLPIDQARNFYEKLVTQFPNAGRYWKAYIEHELRGKNFENVENLFNRCLVKVLNIDLWKCYVFYVRETKGHLSSFREKMAKAYDFALDKVGLDMNSYSIYSDYISFLKTVPAVGQYAENQRISAVRKIYQRGISTPMVNIESLWSDYCNYEKSINPTLAEKLISERNKEYQKIAKQLEAVTRGVNRQAVSVPPRGTAPEMKQVGLTTDWKVYPVGEEQSYGDRRIWAVCQASRKLLCLVVYAYEQSLLCLGYYPDMWYEAALFLQQAGKQLEEKGDVKLAQQMTAEAMQLFDRAISGLMKHSQLLYFAYADFEEERMKFDNVKKIYDNLLAIDHIDPTLTYIQLMKFTRRTEGVRAARAVFKRAREDNRCRHHVFIAAALMEFYCSKDKDVAMRVFDLGLKKYGDEPEYACAYVDFLTHLNEDNNTRVVFERILTSEALSPEKSSDIWDRYLEFESLVGDLASTLKVDERRKAAVTVLQMTLSNSQFKFIFMQILSLKHCSLMAPQRNLPTPQGASVVMGGAPSVHCALPLLRYPRPDIDQMIPFKPKANSAASFHPIPGGVFPPPPAVAELISLLPPPWTFQGPFVSVDLFIDHISKTQLTIGVINFFVFNLEYLYFIELVLLLKCHSCEVLLTNKFKFYQIWRSFFSSSAFCKPVKPHSSLSY
uniref:Suf domain-containing protein n=1 Tax=Angiostrongylus cantonensis TaxID=6313 RepID=A0A0K0DNE5_ANGCA